MELAINPIGMGSGIRTADIPPAVAPADSARTPASETSVERESRAAEAMRELGEKIQEQLNMSNISIAFTPYGAKNERMAIKVMDRETGKVIREIPPEEIRNANIKLSDFAGLIFNKKV
jgi:flagellar protein FlaG